MEGRILLESRSGSISELGLGCEKNVILTYFVQVHFQVHVQVQWNGGSEAVES